PADKALVLDDAIAEGGSGLLEIDADPGMEVSAWIKSRHAKRTFYAGVPVISADLAVAAGNATFLNGLRGDREIASLDLVNLGREKALCQVDFLGADGSAIGAGVAVDVPALSMRPFADALGLGHEKAAVGARVSCDQAFYAYAVGIDPETTEVSFATPSEAADAARYTSKARTQKATVTFTQTGQYHSATREVPKKVLRIPVPSGMRARLAVAEFDFVAGPWNSRLKSGAHGLMWFHRGKFRSNTVANINALGPGKSLVKINQNLDVPAGTVTNAKGALVFEQGKTYHARVAYDAANKSVALTISHNGSVLKTLPFAATAKGRVIEVSPNGLLAEFGHNNNQHLPEVSSIGWKFLNFRLELMD
ncbi:MAG TPA: hypothetical protein VG477_17285, partial [Thermoanaerobaculia bacterium]|nr:hypothetical protein [Thermoanaerobaculia bacterium]